MAVNKPVYEFGDENFSGAKHEHIQIGDPNPYQAGIEIHTKDGIELADDYDNI